jgi:transcriptional antiterminator NusG
MGFVGSSGQGAKPIPISIYEYEISANENTGTNDVDKVTGEITPQTPAGTQVYETTLVPQMMITINSGQFAGSQGIIKSIDKTTGIASVEIEMFGRSQLVDVEFSDIAE